MEIALLLGFFLWLACGLIAASIGAKQGHGCIAFIFGILLGPLGILIAIMSGTSGRKQCQFCKEMIHRDAAVCPHCRRELTETK